MVRRLIGLGLLLLVAVIWMPKPLLAMTKLFSEIFNGITNPVFISNLWVALPLLAMVVGIWFLIK